jgi:hypothetical protein
MSGRVDKRHQTHAHLPETKKQTHRLTQHEGITLKLPAIFKSQFYTPTRHLHM